jgi:hypothetical protein
MTLRSRIGQFAVFIGVILLIVFFVTDQLKTPNYYYLFLSVGFLLLGINFIKKGRSPTQSSGRFRLFHQPDDDQEKEEL